MFKTIVHNLRHTIEFWRWKNLKSAFLKHGTEFLVILIIWEIVEDIIFPAVMYLCGETLNPVFYSLIPAGWIVCLHPIAVPVLWSMWRCLKRSKDSD